MSLLAVGVLGRLAARLRSREAPVAVLGLGYVGLPLLVAAGSAGFPVIGFDTAADRIAQLRRGRSYIGDVTDSEVAALGGVEISADPAILDRAEVLVICVPTPLTDHAPDLTHVRRAAEAAAAHLSAGRLVILQSTTYPGTTEDILRPILETSGLIAGRDFALAYSPERIDPGQVSFGIHNTPKVVGGCTDRCRDLTVSFYSSFVDQVVVTRSPREAEMAKLIENTFRQVNIALVNELATAAQELGVDIWGALEAASTKPFGYMPFWPGPGVGGHCIAIDPSYLSWRASQALGHGLGFIEHANQVNDQMPAYIVSRIGEMLNDAGKALKGARVLVVGVTYKSGVEDMRGSPALAVMGRLARKGTAISYHDPYVGSVPLAGSRLESLPLDAATVGRHDLVAILTAHPDIDYASLVRAAQLVFDARGVTVEIDAPNVSRL
jgi:UDP-N-acetyl-D-glucosamine dehydrogenase